MRSIRAGTLIPPSLAANPDAPTGARQVRELSVRPGSFPAHWNKPDARGRLYGRQGRVCAFCGSALNYNDRGDVEHFRPKSKVRGSETHDGYWWLAYDLRNLMLACRRCNSSLKGTRFPLLADETQRVTHGTRASLSAEPRALLLALEDPIEDLLVIELDDILFRVHPSPGLGPIELQRAEEHIRFFRLNTEPQLVRDRMAVVDQALQLLHDGAVDDVRAGAAPFSPHSRGVQLALALAGIAPPSAFEARVQLLRQLGAELEVAVELRELETTSGPAHKFMREVGAALAWMVMDAPLTEQAGLRSELESLGGGAIVGVVDEIAADLGL